MSNQRWSGVMGLVMLTCLASQSQADIGTIHGYVNRVLTVGNGDFGGCMAMLSTDPSSVLPGCGAHWVTFSCTGDFADQALAFRMFDQAQLAFATNKVVMVQVSDNQKHNGYCYANRIDVIR